MRRRKSMLDFSSVLNVDTAKTSCHADAKPKMVERNGVCRTILLSEKGWEQHCHGVVLLQHSHPWLSSSDLAWLINGDI